MSARLENAGAGALRAPALCFVGVEYCYANAAAPALTDVSLSLRPGEVVALVGRNGSGKSTLAQLSNGLRLPTRGAVTVDGIPTADDSRLWEARSRVGLLFQDPNQQIVGATVEEDVAFGLENLGVTRPEMRARVEAILEQLELTEVRERMVHQLSGGQRQRVALAGVLVLRPSVLVADEPASLLDAGSARELFERVRELAAGGTAVLWITQDADEVLATDRVAVLEAGRLIFDGAPVELFRSGAAGRAGLRLPRAARLARQLARTAGCAEAWDNGPPLTESDLLRAIIPCRATGVGTGGDAGGRGGGGGRALGGGPATAAAEEGQASAPGFRHPAGAEEAVQARLVEASGLSFVYDERTPFAQPAVTEVDLALGAGEVVALIGPTASGKTTLLQMLAGILPPAAGRVVRSGLAAMAFQRPEDLLYCSTVQEDVEAGPAFQGLEGFVLNRRVETALAIVGLDAGRFGSRSSLELSLGEQRRVALAAILALEPQLLLLDEPGAGLDGQGRLRIMSGIRDWVREDERRSLVFSTHDLEEAAAADRVILLAGGRKLADGIPQDVLGRPDVLASADLEAPVAARIALALGCPPPLPLDGRALGRWLMRDGDWVGGRDGGRVEAEG